MRVILLGIGAVLFWILLIYFLDGCDNKGKEPILHDTIEVVKEKILVQEKEVIRWKEQKTKIVYKTKFDTLATIDTVIVELIKCDSMEKIDSKIIAKQDTIIKEQVGIIEVQDQDIKGLNKEVKKQKRNVLLTKIVAVLVLVSTLIILK